ncbi:hypothetical protein [Alicycliphilus denitrificans]|uniref:hypothetical protein n=1 Tax=Alicycliphilus denitrificans TaxID=179636 RepID=UPI00384F28C2
MAFLPPFLHRMAAMVASASCLALLAVAPSAGWAQAGNPFLGQWVVTWEGKARMQQADLQITDSGGSWKTFASQKNAPCVGREVAVRHDAVGEQEMRLTLLFSEALQGCKDSQLTLVRHPDGRVTGQNQSSGDRELTLVRK